MKKLFNYFYILTLIICLTKMGKKVDAKIEDESKKYGKVNLIFEFFI